MEQKMTVQDAIFSFRQEIGFALEDKDRSLEVIAQDIKEYAEMLYLLSFESPTRTITLYENPMGGFGYTREPEGVSPSDEGEI